MKLTVFQKGLVLLVLPLLFQLVFFLAVFRYEREYAEAEHWATHTKEVIARAHEIHTTVTDARAGVQGYVITTDPKFAEPYRHSRRDLSRQFDDLINLVQDNLGQTAQARTAQAAARATVDWLGGVERSVRDGARDEAAARVRSGVGYGRMEDFRRELATFLAEEGRLDRERQVGLVQARDRLNVVFAFGGLSAVACTFGLAYGFRRGIARRFAAVEANARRLAAGETLPPPLDGGDEIASLDRAFRAMAAELTRASDAVRDLYDYAPCGYHSVDPDGTLVAINRTELRWLGYEAGELVGRVRFVDLVDPGSRGRYLTAFAGVKEHGAAADVELELVRKDGTTFPVLVNSSAVRAPDGRYLRSRTTLTDLTARKQAEDAVRRLNADLEGRLAELARYAEALRVSEEQFRLLVEGVRDYAILLLDPDGRVVSWNAAAARIKGYAAEEVVGRHFSLFYPTEVVARNWPERELETARAEGRFEDEGWRVRKDGSRFWANVVITAIRDGTGALRGFGKVTRDVTERKRAEAAVRLFADVAHYIPIGLLIYQLDGEPPVLRVRSGNRTASSVLGVPLDEAGGRAVTDLFPTTPPDRLRRYTAVAASGRADDLGEFQYGDERWWTVLAFPLPDRSVGIAFQDVTARRRAEDEVRRLNAELEGRVRARTAELEAANRDLAQKNDENEMFVYSVSHDLRSPLVNLQGFSRELEKACQQLTALLAGEAVPPAVRDRGRVLLDGKMAKAVGFIQTAVLRLSGIIDALLRLSRVGRVEYRRETVDVGRVVAQVVGAAQGTIAERGAVVRVDDLPPAWGDRTAIEQLFGNLIGNALTYLDPVRPGVIEVGCLSPDAGGFRTYFVKDNGLGIADGHRQKIFQAFQRAHPGVGSGEGLGLAIVSRVAERHRGRVWVETTPGEGSTFFVTLPTTVELGGR